VIRFSPDSWLDVVMRPLDMVSPEANLYVEIAAPDVRLAAALLLAIAGLVFWRRASASRRPAFLLLAVLLLAMVPWLATTGNGRYFIAFLIVLGPLCVGLAGMLPWSRSMKFAAVLFVGVIQLVLLQQSPPWGTWALSSWRDAPYFQIDAPQAAGRSYVTVSPISYSLIAPQFPADARWLSLSAPVMGPLEKQRIARWFTEAGSLHLLVPVVPSEIVAGQQPSAALLEGVRRLLAPRGLFVADGARCDFLPSRGLLTVALRGRRPDEKTIPSNYGFWVCPLRYDPASAASPPADGNAEIDAVFEAVEKLCPRFFTPGHPTIRIEGGYTRRYPSDTRVYILDDGEVRYKFWRSLNATTIGRAEDLRAGRGTLDCSKIRAPTWRSGGP
jgi:hypothetical protein